MRVIGRRSRFVVLAALGALTAACGTSTEPDAAVELDTEAALADHDALTTALEAAELEAFRALAGRTPYAGAFAGVEGVGARAAAGDDGGSFAVRLARTLAGRAAAIDASSAPIISETHRGATFVFDPDQGEYAVDPDRTGAPETGVRFVLYELDDSGVPLVDEEIGHADLVDEGDGSAEDVVLHLSAVVHDETVVDYRTTLDDGGDRGLLTVRGFLVGERVRLDFDIEAVGRRSEGRTLLDVAFELRVDERDFSITGTVHGAEEGGEGEGEIDVVVRHRAHSLRIDVEAAEGEIDGTVFLNGDVFATVTGPVDEPTFVGGSGEPLTFWERLVLHRIVDRIEDVFDLLEDLIDPVADLVLLGFVL